MMEDQRIYRVAINGFPYKSASELGVENDFDAYFATKQAIYSVLYDRDVTSMYRGANARGDKIVNAINNLTNIGRYGTQTFQSANIQITKVGGLQEESNYYSQTYKATSAVQMSNYDIISTANMPSGAYISDLNGNAKTSFSGGENFKVMIPKSSMNSDINIVISAMGKCRTYPVFYGQTTVAGTQNYLVTTDPYGDYVNTANLNVRTNTGKIDITKLDSETNEPISNTTFQLKNANGAVVANSTTNSNGKAEFNNLYQGNYTLTEISANDKYILNNQSINIAVNYNKTNSINLTNEHKKGNLKIVKVDKDNHNVAIGGVIFDLFSREFNRVVGTYTTNVNGEITINNLRIGDYSLIEKSTNKWYNLASDTSVKINWNSTNNATIENELKKGQIKVIKVDKDNNEVKLAGVKFNVLDKDNRVLETIITNSNGEALTSRYAIRDYSNLKIQECQTLSNYVLNDEIKTLTLKEEQIVNVTFENELKKGQIKVIKVDLDNNEVKLKGVEFKVIDEDGKLVDTLITNENGEAVSKRLRIDKEYTLQETKTLSNYVLNENTQKVILQENQILDVTFQNELKKGQIKVIKVDLDNNEVKLKGVKFKVIDEDGKLLDTLITDENGEAVSKKLRIDKEYTLQECQTLSNYVLNEETQKVTLQENQITDMIFENEKIKGYIQVIKTSAEDNQYSKLEKGSSLEGATFEVYDEENNLVDTITTDETGKAITKELLKGKYTIKEITSPIYYILNINEYNAEIVNDQEIVDVDITNDNIVLDIEIQKNGFVETQSKDDIFYNFKNIKNNSNVPLDNFTWSDNLPTDAVRINKIYTGTWNEDLEYSVYYKTNKTEEYVLFKDKLNTQKIYELNFKDLKLAEDEYVTDYEFRFGTVKIGFQEIESPLLYCDIVDGLGNGYVFTNNTKVSGTYYEAYVEDTDKWTTITYFKEIRIDEVLPRTR